jgi:hypothetical protein
MAYYYFKIRVPQMQSVNAMATNKNSRSDMTPKKNLAQ